MRKRNRLTLCMLATLLTSACVSAGFPLQSPPESVIPYSDVIGTWENDIGAVIEFQDDGVVSGSIQCRATFVSGCDQNQLIEFEGDWILCDTYIFEDGNSNGSCNENTEGYWIVIDSYYPDVRIDRLVFTEESSELAFYSYNSDVQTPVEEWYTRRLLARLS